MKPHLGLFIGCLAFPTLGLADPISEGKSMVDEHLKALTRMAPEIEKASSDSASLNMLRYSLQVELKELGEAEAGLAEKLKPEEKQEIVDYVREKATPLLESISQTLKKIEVEVVDTPDSNELSRSDGTGRTTAFAHQHGDSYAMGFLVCHIKCCKGHAGRGVAIGVGCWDCSDHLFRDGCP